MNMFGAAFFGGLLKLYDDMEDIPAIAQYSSSQFMEILKSLIITSFTYVSIHNMNFPIIIFIAHIFHFLITDRHALSTNFYHAGMIVALLLSIITVDISKLEMASFILPTLNIFVGAYLDHTLFPEEYSWKKIIWRTIISISVIIFLRFSTYIPYYDILLFFVGYCTISVLIMTYLQCSETNSSNEPTKDLMKEPLSQETNPTSKKKDIQLQMD